MGLAVTVRATRTARDYPQPVTNLDHVDFRRPDVRDQMEKRRGAISSLRKLQRPLEARKAARSAGIGEFFRLFSAAPLVVDVDEGPRPHEGVARNLGSI